MRAAGRIRSKSGRTDALIGGLYGLIIGKAYFGESMFSSKPMPPRSRCSLARRCCGLNLGLIDCQVQSSHLLSLGASIVPREQFVGLLKTLVRTGRRFEDWPDSPIRCAELLDD